MQLPLMSFSEFLDILPDAALVVDAQMHIVLANQQAHLTFGYPTGTLYGETIHSLVPIHNRQIHTGFVHEFRSNPTTRPMGTGLKLAARRCDGKEFPVEIMLRPFQIQDSFLVLCLVRDISERVNSELALRQSHDKYRHLVENTFNVVLTQESPVKVWQEA